VGIGLSKMKAAGELAPPRAFDRVLAWFLPRDPGMSRTERELARTFVFTHLFGPVISQPMWIYLYVVATEVDSTLVVLAAGSWSFWALPFLLRWTGSLKLGALASFQMLAAISLFGAYHYGGFSSPFLPWLIVSLLLGLCYQSKNAGMVIAVFALDLVVFACVVAVVGIPDRVPLDDLRALGWLSITSATVYMTWMALHYARIIGLRTELETEIDRQHATSIELERARAMAEETGQARARFFSKMSHDLRTPLNAIIGYSDILLEDCESDCPARSARATDIQRINAAGRHLLSLVSDVLDAKHIEDDVVAVASGEFELGALRDEVVATAKPMVERNGNAFVVVCAHPHYVLHTDARKLRQILLNLLSNAGKFTHGGTVKLDMHILLHPHEHQLVATVSDTGIGIAPEALPRLFNDYEQADPSVFNRFGGTGIGLALSRKLSILLGGDITVASRVRHGSRFTVTVPAHLQPVCASGARPSGAEALSPTGRREVDGAVPAVSA
jgi:signal transduction histidine kinase